MLLGAAGLDYEIEDKPAGLHTHMPLAGAAARLVLLSDVVIGRFSVGLGTALVRSDPVRAVEGLTTAAWLLLAAGMGVWVTCRNSCWR